MPFAALMLAAAAICADPGYCPSADQLLRAYQAQVHKQLGQLTAEARLHPDQITSLSEQVILGVTDMQCGQPAPAQDAPATVSCTAVFHYYGKRLGRTVVLAQTQKGWVMQGEAAP